ncbi:MAG: SpoIIE family protein phosphatase [Bryobacteraceae bacterium]|nr:SpoIIE family protein phosphatase [Bryobacteraceae bacterium]
MAEISILTADGKTRTHVLEGERVGLGRANTNELCYPDDSGLSRQHLLFQREGEEWLLVDPGSKNGTTLNGDRITTPRKLVGGDKIQAGHLTIVYGVAARPFNETVVFIDTRDEKTTVSRSLADVLSPGAQRLEKPTVSADKIGALIKAGNQLSQEQELDKLFPIILDLAIEAVQAERGVLLAYEGESLDVKASSGGNFRISQGVRERVLRGRESLLINDVLSDEAFKGMQSLVQQQVRMFMAVPLQTNDQVLGLIYVDSPTLVREFAVEDLNLLTVMANIAAVRIERARLAEIEQAEKIMAKDLEQAAVIQRGLLPSRAPIVPGLDLAGHNVPCRTVGGDYYDFLQYPDGKIGVALGDVSGKAMPAALLMTSLQARLRVISEDITDVADLMNRLNRHTAANTPSNRFITLFFMIIDPATGEVSYCNAGHNPPYLARVSGEIEELQEGGLILGLFGQARYASAKVEMATGDIIVVFSDGVSEAQNGDQDEFGEERLKQVILATHDKSAADILQAIIQSVADFAAGAPAADDVTLVVVRRVS